MSTTRSFVRTLGRRKGKYTPMHTDVRSDHYQNRGLELLMDFGVMDTTTCTPMNHTFVEIWHGESPLRTPATDDL